MSELITNSIGVNMKTTDQMTIKERMIKELSQLRPLSEWLTLDEIIKIKIELLGMKN